MHKFDINVFTLSTRTIANPAPGADFIIPAISELRMEIIAITFTFDSDGNAANRIIHLHHINDSKDTQGTTASGAIILNEVINVEISQGMLGQDLTAATQTITMPLPLNVFLQTGDTFASEVANIQVGDQISDIQYRVKTWGSL